MGFNIENRDPSFFAQIFIEEARLKTKLCLYADSIKSDDCMKDYSPINLLDPFDSLRFYLIKEKQYKAHQVKALNYSDILRELPEALSMKIPSNYSSYGNLCN